MPGTPAWLASAEAVLNRNIAASTQAAALARRLEGTSLQVDVDGITRVRTTCFGGRAALLAGDDSPADAVISGSVPALLQMLKVAAPGAAARSSLQIRGDAEIANLYRDLFAAARPDLEEELSRWVGDLPARRLSLLAKSVRTWARRARRTAGENIAEYLQEEGRDLVARTELEEFLRGVDTVRDSVDRIEARLLRLEQRVKSGA
ncbi:MAG TPA: SCP2 sterol-binding domain-containing protein [Steroidobacteraceae bacterium]|jgi:ubiquinone biosynthesis protein UbiJ|nr:SCP2 sterol-binding domain-containing protein [Steroidobacteraceae bacterium]